MSTSTSPVILEIHSLELDLECKDVPPFFGQTDSGKLRPFLTLCYAPQASRMMSYRLHTGVPDRRTVATVLHEALVQLREQSEGPPTEDQPLQSPMVFGHGIQYTCYSQGIHIRFVSPNQRISGAIERFFSRLNTRLLHSVPTNTSDQGTQPGSDREYVTLAEIERMLSRFSKQYCHSANRMAERHSHSYWLAYSCTKRADPHVFASLLEGLDDQNTTIWSKRDQDPRMEPGNCTDLPPEMSIVVILDPSLLIPETQDGSSLDERISPTSKREEQPALEHPEMCTPEERATSPKEGEMK